MSKQLIRVCINKEHDLEMELNALLSDGDFVRNLTFVTGLLGGVLAAWAKDQARNTELTEQEILKMGAVAFKEYIKYGRGRLVEEIPNKPKRKLNS